MIKIGAVLILVSMTALAGPPFQTDDPQPIGFREYEFYTFAVSDGTTVETDLSAPALEFNWGAVPNVHLHIILPAATVLPAVGPRAFGLGDTELGIKYRFVQETKHRPMIGTFVMFEIPTGDAAKGLGVGKTWYKLPLWAQKSFGPWTTYGGGGETIVKAPGFRSYPFAGWLVQRDIGKKWTLGSEVFYHGPEGIATAQTRPVHAGRLRRILQVSRSRVSGAVLLRTHGDRPEGELRLPGALLDLGRQEGSGQAWGCAAGGRGLQRHGTYARLI